LNFNLLWLREARKRLALAAASVIAGTNFVARIATTVTATTEPAEQFLQADSRQVKQVASTTVASVITWIACVTARIASHVIARIAVADFIARIAVVITATTQPETLEQTPERELRRATTIITSDVAARIASHVIARIAVADFIARIARIATMRSKQIAQAFA